MRAARFLPILLPALALPGQRAAADDLLASAPIEAVMFRDGEIQRSAEPYGQWTLVCDTLSRLGRRFCSMNAAPVALGAGSLALTVSTGDDGRPAALLHLPLGLSLPFGIRVKALGPGQGAPERRVPVALCSATRCEAAWSLGSGEIAALQAGAGLRLTLRGWHFAATSRRGEEPVPVAATIGGQGFAQAVAASLK